MKSEGRWVASLTNYGEDNKENKVEESNPQPDQNSVAAEMSDKVCEQSMLCDSWKQMGLKMFESNNISGGTFNINFNIKN